MAKAIVSVLIALAAVPAIAQQAVARQSDGLDGELRLAVLGQCPNATEMDSSRQKPLLEGYTVRAVTIDNPFQFLPWVRRRLAALKDQLDTRTGQPFRLDQQKADRQRLLAGFVLPETDFVPVKIDAVVVTVNHCDQQELDVSFAVLSSQFLPVRVATTESLRRLPDAPEETANVAPRKTFELVPTAGYNHTDRLFGGGSLHVRTNGKTPGVSAIELQGAASTSYQTVSASLKGSASPERFGIIEWRAGYDYESLPTGSAPLAQGRFIGQVSATTNPLGEAGVALRFGGLVESGYLQSGFTGADVAPDAVASAGFSSVRLFSGVTFGTKHHSFTSSYGLELGVNRKFDSGWRRHVGDIAWLVWFPIGDHRPLQIESRFTAGAIQTGSGGKVPIARRFFGGSAQESFIEGDDWDFRANPVLRGMPPRSFYRTSAGAGADRFYALNLTFAPALWRQPLLPSELTEEEDFKEAVDFQWGINSALLASTEMARDSHFPAVVDELQPLKSALDNLTAAVDAIKDSIPSDLKPAFSSCHAGVTLAVRRAASAIAAAKPDAKYSFIAALVDEGPSKLVSKALDACENHLNSVVHDADLSKASAALRGPPGQPGQFDKFEAAYRMLDRQAAEAKAERQLRYPKRVFNTVLHDLNIWSVSPVVVFDTAHIWPDMNGSHGLRYGPGAGLRLTLVGHANLTVGYAFNLNRGPGEGRGAVFFSIHVTELLK